MYFTRLGGGGSDGGWEYGAWPTLDPGLDKNKLEFAFLLVVIFIILLAWLKGQKEACVYCRNPNGPRLPE